MAIHALTIIATLADVDTLMTMILFRLRPVVLVHLKMKTILILKMKMKKTNVLMI